MTLGDLLLFFAFALSWLGRGGKEICQISQTLTAQFSALILCHPVQSKASSDLSPVEEVPGPGVLRGGDPDHVVAGVHPLRLAVPAQVEVRADATLEDLIQ